ncbi:hypothetical protein B5M43_013675 [Microbacterium sp. MEC084]|uniref:hypothetical protein n=1 Tax=unclassified Microbacterium TaxID=2609290 RepID=UPI0006FCAF92|nr:MULTISPECIES: hypothetical protein [unclassified Microbacterium]KQZ11802.1 hypothetical protein ASD19_00530 [Microbacterium sp. Root53]MCD1269872.1 hypothetical protein [Microbacterium sp. MEC084]
MSLMDRVREIRADEARVDETQLGTARQALLREIGREQRKSTQRWVGFKVAAGGLAAISAVVAGTLLVPLWTDQAATAAEVLDQVADATISAQDTQLAPGQYLRVDRSWERVERWSSALADDDDPNTHPFVPVTEPADGAIHLRKGSVLFVPADRSDDWVYDTGPAESVVASYGQAGDRAAAEKDHWIGESEPNQVIALPGGKSQFLGRTALLDLPVSMWEATYEDMPRDPHELLQWYHDRYEAEGGRDEQYFDDWLLGSFDDLLMVGLAPPDLRAAMFRMLGLVPEVTLTSVDGDVATLSHVGRDGTERVLRFDVAEGTFEAIGIDQLTSGPGSDAAAPMQTISFSIVDSAPDPTQ